ncbi:GspE/PulE family protein [Peptoniphilus sp. KCTC 25270]|uniref:GspE/PulE family protein n=1 Tax=Peptoniphilus sp. KCTC 25270 TaxID=2897414 RepID=UPI001E48FC8C|nr:GspE/PulE family protein [Peptoniphilus sp. KCTC 25270]MCD1147078.1 GspE/PulE family protein [Peptoniphilus sp. KCTC 25270]
MKSSGIDSKVFKTFPVCSLDNGEGIRFGILKYSHTVKDDMEFLLGHSIELVEVSEKIFFGEEARKEEPSSLFEERENGEEETAVHLLEHLIEYAAENLCSDIHIEPFQKGFRIRMRKNGSLFVYRQYNSSLLSELIARIKILSSLDISEKRKPQDGRFTQNLKNKKIDIRVSSISTIVGEKIVLRLLDPLGLEYSMEGIGMNEKQRTLMELLLKQPQGLILVAGPTGSGKTSTLYTFLQQLNTEERNIITIEDPVEFQIPGVNQIQVNPKAGITFENGLKSMLRQDPEVLMIGEIRNAETAEIALRSSITGHLVTSTIHTSDSPSSIIRLLDMGVEPYMVSAGITAVISQRLVRVLCPKCKTEEKTNDSIFALDNQTIYKKVGCQHCKDGYVGRKAVFEILIVNDKIRSMIHKDLQLDAIRKQGERMGMVSLKENLRELLLQGETSLEEAYRAITTL